jgi:hypothetical protein
MIRNSKASTKADLQGVERRLTEFIGDYGSTKKGITHLDQMNDHVNIVHSSQLLRAPKISRGFLSKEKIRDQDEQEAMHYGSWNVFNTLTITCNAIHAAATQRAQFCPRSKKTPQASAPSSPVQPTRCRFASSNNSRR